MGSPKRRMYPNVVKTFKADYAEEIHPLVRDYAEEKNLIPIHTSTACMVGGNRGYIFVTVTFESLYLYE